MTNNEQDRRAIEAVLARLETETDGDPTVLRKLTSDYSTLYRKISLGSSMFTERERELLFWAFCISKH
jgi:hypothetical protein